MLDFLIAVDFLFIVTPIVGVCNCSMFYVLLYHNHNMQTTSWHRPEKPLNHHKTPGRQTKQCNQLSLPHQMIAIIEWTQSNVQQNIEHRTITDSHNHMHF